MKKFKARDTVMVDPDQVKPGSVLKEFIDKGELVMEMVYAIIGTEEFPDEELIAKCPIKQCCSCKTYDDCQEQYLELKGINRSLYPADYFVRVGAGG